MIPKIIHYCWFGRNPLPEKALICIDSWRKYLPNYKIKEWNEENFDVNICPYVKEAYEAKKYAFVSDFVRLYALTTEGGIYMDTDVEVIKSLDNLLDCEAFSGFESIKYIPTGIMACKKGFDLFKEFLNDYYNCHFKINENDFDMTTNVVRITKICKKYGFIPNNKYQNIKGFIIYPSDYFCPKDNITQIVNITSNTYTIHHFSGSWVPDEDKFRLFLRRKYLNYIPDWFGRKIAWFKSKTRYNGLPTTIRETFNILKFKIMKMLGTKNA